MDTTEQYIRMRLAAIPDLGRGIPPTGALWHKESGEPLIDMHGNWFAWDDGGYCQLERQDQLQEMVFEKKQSTLLPPLRKLLLCFDEFVHPNNYCLHGEHEPGFFGQGACGICLDEIAKQEKQFTSMEQLWLAFVMKEKYGKVWNGEDWEVA